MVMGSMSACVSCGKTLHHGCVREMFDDYCDACNPIKPLVETPERERPLTDRLREEEALRKLFGGSE